MAKVAKLLLHFLHLYQYWCVLCPDFYISDYIQMCKTSVLIYGADEMQVSSEFFPNVYLVKIEVHIIGLCTMSLGKRFATLEVKIVVFSTKS